MDEIEQRLRESTDACIKSYESWRAKEKDAGVREALQEAVHELRKVASRLEIEMAISERGEMADRPLPIPPHRSSRRGRSDNSNYEDSDDNVGNSDPQSAPSQNRGRSPGSGRSRRPQKQS